MAASRMSVIMPPLSLLRQAILGRRADRAKEGQESMLLCHAPAYHCLSPAYLLVLLKRAPQLASVHGEGVFVTLTVGFVVNTSQTTFLSAPIPQPSSQQVLYRRRLFLFFPLTISHVFPSVDAHRSLEFIQKSVLACSSFHSQAVTGALS
jgi:hypothetical protein